jgi:hypothetical protein
MDVLALEVCPIDQFFDILRQAMLENDVPLIVASHCYPVAVSDRQQTVILKDRAAAGRAYQVLRRLYADLGLASIETRWVVEHRVSRDFLIAEVAWRLLDRDTKFICDQRSTYTLRHDGATIKIAAVFFHEDGPSYCGHA